MGHSGKERDGNTRGVSHEGLFGFIALKSSVVKADVGPSSAMYHTPSNVTYCPSPEPSACIWQNPNFQKVFAHGAFSLSLRTRFLQGGARQAHRLLLTSAN